MYIAGYFNSDIIAQIAEIPANIVLKEYRYQWRDKHEKDMDYKIF